MTNLKDISKDISSELLFDALINAHVSDREWVEALVACASKYQTLQKAMIDVFRLSGLHLSPNNWVRVKEAAQQFNPKPPQFIYSNSYTSLVFICDNFHNAGKCIFANKPEEAVNWILSGKDSKRAILPKKKTKKSFTGARLQIDFRKRDDRTAWNKCK